MFKRYGHYFIIALSVIVSITFLLLNPKNEQQAPKTKSLKKIAKKDINADLPKKVISKILKGRFVAKEWLKGAQKIAFMQNKIIVANGVWLKIFSLDGKIIAESKMPEGFAQALEVFDLDQDGNKDIILGIGNRKQVKGFLAKVLIFYNADIKNKPETVLFPETSRALLRGIIKGEDKNQFWALFYASKYVARILKFSKVSSNKWHYSVSEKIISAWAFSRGNFYHKNKKSFVVARSYGDVRGSFGDVSTFDNKQRQVVPSTRGVRAVLVIKSETNYDSLIFTDGWHSHYAKYARGLISRADWKNGEWKYQILANVKGRFGFDNIRIGSVTGVGKKDLIASGNGPVLVIPYHRPSTEFVYAIKKSFVTDAYPFDSNNDGIDEIILIGKNAGIWYAK